MSQNMISRLILGTKIDAGHFGEVYEGTDPVLGKVAVKLLRRAMSETQDEWAARKRGFLNEGQRLRDAEHDNVVRVYQILEAPTDDAIWLVMEFCENGSLKKEYLDGPVRLSRLRPILFDAALGLQAIHSRNMIHRDIKPGNILIGTNQRAKISDFGLVSNNLLFGYASLAGYTEHIAKETFELGITSVRTDIWAFGMTTYRLIHGDLFYSRLPRTGSEGFIRRGGFARRLTWLPHIPAEWRRFVRQAIHDEPECRIQSAADILKWLEKLPVTPDWLCSDTGEKTAWERTTSTRRIEVVWSKISPRQHTWEAHSLPLVSGRIKRLGGSSGTISMTKALDELQTFFESHR